MFHVIEENKRYLYTLYTRLFLVTVDIKQKAARSNIIQRHLIDFPPYPPRLCRRKTANEIALDVSPFIVQGNIFRGAFLWHRF